MVVAGHRVITDREGSDRGSSVLTSNLHFPGSLLAHADIQLGSLGPDNPVARLGCSFFPAGLHMVPARDDIDFAVERTFGTGLGWVGMDLEQAGMGLGFRMAVAGSHMQGSETGRLGGSN